MKKATHFLAHAGARYWEDAKVNGIEDVDGTLIPGRVDDYWHVTIELATGKVVGWPDGVSADIHYKVCDDGEYWLLDEDGNKVAKSRGYYVPNRFLCHGDNGFGDYIIMKIGPDGQIADYQVPRIAGDEWKAV